LTRRSSWIGVLAGGLLWCAAVSPTSAVAAGVAPGLTFGDQGLTGT